MLFDKVAVKAPVRLNAALQTHSYLRRSLVSFAKRFM